MSIFFFFFFSNNLKSLRKAKGLTQKQLADLSGVSRVAIARYETGQQTPKKEALEKLAKTLDVSVEELAIEALPFDTKPKEAEPKEIQNSKPKTEKSPRDLAMDKLIKAFQAHDSSNPYNIEPAILNKVYKAIESALCEDIVSKVLNDKEFKEDIMNVISKHLAKTIDGKNATDTKK